MTSNTWFKPPNPTVVIPENEMGLPAGEADVVELLREICHDPELVRFVADMMEQ